MPIWQTLSIGFGLLVLVIGGVLRVMSDLLAIASQLDDRACARSMSGNSRNSGEIPALSPASPDMANSSNSA